MLDQRNSTPDDKYSGGSKKAEQLDLEMHAHLEAGLLTEEPKRLMPAVKGREKPSLWQSLKRFFH